MSRTNHTIRLFAYRNFINFIKLGMVMLDRTTRFARSLVYLVMMTFSIVL